MVSYVNTVDVQEQVGAVLPAFTIVGLPDKAVGESRERVRAAPQALGLSLPPERITVNLAPADLAKEGSHYDLPIALGLLAAMGVVPGNLLAQYTGFRPLDRRPYKAANHGGEGHRERPPQGHASRCAGNRCATDL